MLTQAFLTLIIIALIIYIAYKEKLNYREKKALYSKIGIEIVEIENKSRSKIKNKIKRTMEKQNPLN